MCAGPLNTIDAISSLFLVILPVFACLNHLVQVLCQDVLNAEDLQCFQPSKK